MQFIMPHTSLSYIRIKDGLARYGDRYVYRNGKKQFKILKEELIDKALTAFHVQQLT
jgi:hypothetical protein